MNTAYRVVVRPVRRAPECPRAQTQTLQPRHAFHKCSHKSLTVGYSPELCAPFVHIGHSTARHVASDGNRTISCAKQPFRISAISRMLYAESNRSNRKFHCEDTASVRRRSHRIGKNSTSPPSLHRIWTFLKEITAYSVPKLPRQLAVQINQVSAPVVPAG